MKRTYRIRKHTQLETWYTVQEKYWIFWGMPSVDPGYPLLSRDYSNIWNDGYGYKEFYNLEDVKKALEDVKELMQRIVEQKRSKNAIPKEKIEVLERVVLEVK